MVATSPATTSGSASTSISLAESHSLSSNIVSNNWQAATYALSFWTLVNDYILTPIAAVS